MIIFKSQAAKYSPDEMVDEDIQGDDWDVDINATDVEDVRLDIRA